MKNRDLQEAVESINALAALKLPVKTAFAVALNLKAIQDHLTVYNDQRKRLVEANTENDEEGKPLPVYLPENGPDGKPLLDADGKATPVKGDDGKIINKISAGAVVLKEAGKPFRESLDELLDIAIDDMLTIKRVKISAITGEIAPQHLVNVLWMFQDDVSPAEEKKPEAKTATSAVAG